MIGTIDTRFHREARAAVEAAILEQSLQLADGRAGSFEDYKRRVGFIAGLRASLEILADTEAKIYGDPNDKRK